MSSSTDGGSSQNNLWAWLGLLKWSLQYSDGTRPDESSENMTPMSEEDKAFLEAVMREGIIDENVRMKTILTDVTEKLSKWKQEPYTQAEEEEVEEFLQELRDIVEQIDYARAFAALKGLDFLLGCVGERERVPRSTRLMCLGLLATLAQNNPPVQKDLLELGAIRTLSDLFFVEDEHASETDADGQLRARILQAISAIVRSNEVAESIFCHLEQAAPLLERRLGVGNDRTAVSTTTPLALRKRALFFLRALVTSDSSTRERVRQFGTCIGFVADHMLDDAVEESAEVREMALAMIEQILEQKKSVNVILDRRDAIASLGVRRVSALRGLTGEERDYALVELELWERVLVLLARATRDDETERAPAPMLLEDGDAITTQGQ